MSSKIDQRIVEMSFENQKFEKGINQSRNSLKDFSNALENMGTGKEFTGLERSISSMSSSFSVLEQIGVGALRRIGEMAINTGASLIKNLTIDPLSMGWGKYEEKTASVQTIMNATGKSIDEVNGYLEKLMWFSDETSYGFNDMTAALAQMTSSGGEIETLIPMITGVANATAYAGKGAAEFSRAMYNLNQSYGSGNLQYMDWRSLELAGVAGKDLKQIFIDTAIELGRLNENGETAKGTLVDIGNFGSTLQEKWADTRVMEKAFGKFSELSEAAYELVQAGEYDTAAEAMAALSGQYSELAEKAFKSAQQAKSFKEAIDATLDAVSTGWMQTYEIIFGNLEEATKNFTALTEILWTVFASGAEARNGMLKAIKDLGGIEKAFQSIKNVAIAALTPLKAVSAAFDQFFPPKTARQWTNIISSIETFTRKLIMSEETANKIQRTFAGFFAVLDIGWEVVKLVGNALYEVVGVFIPLNGSILEVTASIGDWLVSLNRSIKETGVLQYALMGIQIAAIYLRDAFATIIDKISKFISGILNAEKPLEYLGKTMQTVFGNVVGQIQEIIKWLSGKFTSAVTGIQKLFKPLDDENGNFLLNILEILKDFIDFLIEDATEGIANFGEALKKLDFNRIATFVTGGVLLLFVNQLSNLTKSMATFITTSNTFVSRWSKKLFGYTTKIKDLAYVFGILSASLFVLSKIPWDELVRGLVGLAGAMTIFVGAYAAIQAITVKSSKAMNGVETFKTAFGLMNLAASVAIMAIAIKQISKIDETEVWRAVGVMTVMTIVIAGYQALSALISTIPGQTIVSVKLTSMAVGIATLLGVVVLLSSISQSTIENGLSKLSGFILIVASIQGLFSTVAMVTGGHKLSTNLIGISAGILALLGVMKILSVIDTSELTKNIQNVFLLGGVLAAIQLMFNIAGRIGGGVKFKTNVLSIQIGMLSMIALIAILNVMDEKTIQNGIENLAKMAGIIGALEILTALAARIGAGNKLQKILGSVTLTMLAFTVLIGVLGLYEQTTIDRGLINISKMVAIITALQVLTALVSRLGNPQSLTSIIGAVSILLTVTGSLALLSMIDQEALRKATTSFAIAVIAIGVAVTSFELISKSLSTLASSMGGFKTIVTKVIPGFTAMVAVVVATVAFLGLINSLDFTNISWDNIGKFAAGIGIITTLVTAFTLLTKAPGLTSGVAGITALVPGFTAMIVAVAAAGALLWALSKQSETIKNISWDAIGKFAVGLGMVGVVATVMSLLSVPLGALGVAFPAVIPGVLTALAGLSLIVLSFAALADIMDTLFESDVLINGIDKLVVVGEGIGRFIGSTISGFSSEILVGFGKGLAEFAEATKDIKADSFVGIGDLAKAILIITGTSMIDGLSRLVNFGRDPIKVFGDSLKTLVGAFNEITVEEANNVSNVLAALAPMAGSLTAFANTAKEIPNSGGIFSLFTGNNDIALFGVQLRLVMDTFKKVTVEEAQDVSNIFIALVPMATSFESFANAAKEIPNSGGVFSLFTGNNDIALFGVQLRLVVDTFNNLDTADVTNASLNLNLMSTGLLPALEKFSTFSNSLESSGGLKQLFTGNTTLSEFGKEIAKFIKELKGVDFSVVRPALESLSGITASFQVVGAEVLANAAESFRNNQQPFQKEITSILDTAIATVDTKKKIMVTSITAVFSEVTSKSNTYVKDFKKLGSDVILGLKNGIESQTPFAVSAIRKTSNSIIKASKSTFKSGSPSKIFTEIGAWLPKSIGNGIERNSKTARLAAINMSESVEEAVRTTLDVHSLSDKFADIGVWLDKSLSSGIQNGKDALLQTAQSLGLDTGKTTIKGITDSVTGGESGITTAITDLLDLLSGSTVVADIGEAIGTTTGKSAGNVFNETYADALSKNSGAKSAASGTAKEISKDAYKIFKEGIDRLKEYNMITLGEELAEWENFAKKYADGTEIRMKADKEAARVRAELQAEEFSNSKRWIEEEKYYKRLSLLEELEAWNRVQKRYEEGHAYRIEAEKEMFRLKQEIQKEEYDNASNWIAEEKFYKRLSLQEELAAWTAVQRTYEKGTENRKKADKEVFRLQEEIVEQRKNLEDEYYKKTQEIKNKLKQDIEELEKSYADAVKSRAQSLYDAYRLFDSVEAKDPIDGEQLLTNLGDQVVAFQTWQQSIRDLGNRGISEGLLNEIEAMGPDAVAEIQALNSLTDEQLTQYVSLWQQKHQLANQQATFELRNMRVSTNEQIKLLRSETAIELDILEETFEDSMAEISRITNAQVRAMAAQMNADIKAMNAKTKAEFMGMQQDIKAMGWTGLGVEIVNNVETGVVTQAESLAQATVRAAQNALNAAMVAIGGSPITVVPSRAKGGHNSMLSTKDFKAQYKEEIAEMARRNNVDLSTGEAMLRNEIYKNGDEAVKALQKTSKNTTKKIEESGKDITAGLIKGIASGGSGVVSAVTSMANAALKTVNKVLGIKSPSTKFFESGMFSMVGFINGFMDRLQSVKDAGKNIATIALESLSSGLANIDSLLVDDLDVHPTITPVLDLTNIESGSKRLGELLDTDNFNLSDVSTKKLLSEMLPVAKSPADNEQDRGASTKADPSYSFVQNNYSPKALSRTDIYRQTKNQISIVKGVLSNQ